MAFLTGDMHYTCSLSALIMAEHKLEFLALLYLSQCAKTSEAHKPQLPGVKIQTVHNRCMRMILETAKADPSKRGHSLLHMHTDLVCAQTGISKQGHELHMQLLRMHTDIICAQTGVSKQGNTLHCLVRMHTNLGCAKNGIS